MGGTETLVAQFMCPPLDARKEYPGVAAGKLGRRVIKKVSKDKCRLRPIGMGEKVQGRGGAERKSGRKPSGRGW